MGALITSALLSASTFTVAIVDPAAVQPEPGFDYAGMALVISAIAALVTAIGGVVLGLRRTSGDEIDRELKKLLAERLKAEEDET